MTPLVVVRAVAGLALPLALAGAALARSHERSERRTNEEIDQGDSPSTPSPRPGLPGGSLTYYLEHGGNPHRVDLRSSSLDGIDLTGRDLSGVDLSHASLRRAVLAASTLTDARLDHADLSRADLIGAKLAAASLIETSLWRADIRGADLRTCPTLIVANLRGARYDRRTKWPPGFDPGAAGARLTTGGPH